MQVKHFLNFQKNWQPIISYNFKISLETWKNPNHDYLKTLTNSTIGRLTYKIELNNVKVTKVKFHDGVSCIVETMSWKKYIYMV
jgi:hypothetical protein